MTYCGIGAQALVPMLRPPDISHVPCALRKPRPGVSRQGVGLAVQMQRHRTRSHAMLRQGVRWRWRAWTRPHTDAFGRLVDSLGPRKQSYMASVRSYVSPCPRRLPPSPPAGRRTCRWPPGSSRCSPAPGWCGGGACGRGGPRRGSPRRRPSGGSPASWTSSGRATGPRPSWKNLIGRYRRVINRVRCGVVCSTAVISGHQLPQSNSFQDFSMILNQISRTKLKSRYKHEKCRKFSVLRAYAGWYFERLSLKNILIISNLA